MSFNNKVSWQKYTSDVRSTTLKHKEGVRVTTIFKVTISDQKVGGNFIFVGYLSFMEFQTVSKETESHLTLKSSLHVLYTLPKPHSCTFYVIKASPFFLWFFS